MERFWFDVYFYSSLWVPLVCRRHWPSVGGQSGFEDGAKIAHDGAKMDQNGAKIVSDGSKMASRSPK